MIEDPPQINFSDQRTRLALRHFETIASLTAGEIIVGQILHRVMRKALRRAFNPPRWFDPEQLGDWI